MKYLKGCLVSVIGIVLIVIIGLYLYKNSVISNLEKLNSKVELDWKSYIENIKNRNIELKKQILINDSLNIFLLNFEKMKTSEFSREFEFNEYKINRIAKPDSLMLEYYANLNSKIENYNQSVREYNFFRITFPNSLIARKTKFKREFEYFNLVKYGFENQNPKIKRKKIDDWIVNGGEYPK